MYALASNIQTTPVISLQTGTTVAWTKGLILDIGSLEIKAFRCHDEETGQNLILLARDVRQFAQDCIIVDSPEELSNPDDIVRLKAMIAQSYDPIDKPVVSDSGRKLGNVEDYSLNLETCRIQKLFVRQSMLRSWLGSSLIVDRTQIIDISPKQITVRDASVKGTMLPTEPIPGSPTV
jgi:sporulation protein YlmC with PRC-barrel domain